jgi:hypothetical protein
MAFEDFRENIASGFKYRWEQFQESDLYISLNEKYENLSPKKQKLTVAGIAVALVYLFFSIPYGYYSSSSEMVTSFEDTRGLLRDLLKASKDAQNLPEIPVPPNVEALQAQVTQQLQAARLLPEQIQGNEISQEKPNFIPGTLTAGVVKVSLSKLNVRQVSDLGYQLQAISPSVKLVDLSMEANTKYPRYFDVIYKLAILNIPEPTEMSPEPPPPRPKKRGG